MLKVTFFIQRSDGHSEADDDTIRIYDADVYSDMVRVVYSTPEVKRESTFYLTVPNALLYVRNMLKTLNYDSQPFEYVQVSTSIHPSVLYHVSDLDDSEIRWLIEDTVEVALRSPVLATKRQ
jgi:hypothetical protein